MESARRFSSGDLSSECDDADDPSLPPAARPPPTTNQPMPGGPPNIPPPPGKSFSLYLKDFFLLKWWKIAPGSAAGPDLSLSLGKQQPQQQAAPQRGVSAPSSPAKSRESLLQRVQSLTGAARDQGASIIGMLTLSTSISWKSTLMKLLSTYQRCRCSNCTTSTSI